MEDEDRGPEEAPAGMIGRRSRPTISYKRRLEIHALAVQITEMVLEKTQAHERCLLRRQVETLLPGEE